jgi:inositol-hexakisphosphate/diphosphoinositol-pentakisphosphate 1-kinase
VICSHLLGKLLADMASMREESFATAGLQHADDSSKMDEAMGALDVGSSSSSFGVKAAAAKSMAPMGASGEGETLTASSGTIPDIAITPIKSNTSDAAADPDPDDVVGADPEDDDDGGVLHRLCPTYAQDVNSPLRHVRTRIYFTSESHIHSLVNVLRFCHLWGDEVLNEEDGAGGLISDAGQRALQAATELDYMTHLVLRMFENKRLPLDDPGRFRVEVLFSPGAAYDPLAGGGTGRDHVLPVAPRAVMHAGSDGEMSFVSVAFSVSVSVSLSWGGGGGGVTFCAFSVSFFPLGLLFCW